MVLSAVSSAGAVDRREVVGLRMSQEGVNKDEVWLT